MYLPRVRGTGRKAQRQVVEFGGLNYTQNVRDGELESASGVSARMWPCLTTREGRTAAPGLEGADDLYAWDKLVAVKGSSLLYDGQAVGTVTPGRKQFAVVNTKLCVFPDKKCLDLETMTVEELGVRAELVPGTARFSGDTLEVKLSVDGESGKKISLSNIDTMLPFLIRPYQEEDLSWDAESGWTLPDMAQAWEARGGTKEGISILTAAVGDCLLLRKEAQLGTRYDCSCAKLGLSWADEYDTHGDYYFVTDKDRFTGGIELICEQRRMSRIPKTSFRSLRAGDRVNISGCVTAEGNNRESLEVKEVTDHAITFALPDGVEFDETLEAGAVVVERVVPELDFICQSNNRLFGCSSKDQTIYASALGDPTNWFTYAGLASDSYAVAVGSPGDFTGCCAYGSAVLFWKENTLHKLMGLYPEEYEVISYQFVGVQAGCERSIQNINEVLIYKGRDGVYTYTGGYPQKISGKLGLVDYDGAVAGSDGRGYVASMRRVDTGAWETLRYDLETGTWMGEDGARVTAFATLEGVLYSLVDGTVYRREGLDDQEEGIAWEAVFAPVSETVHGKKGYSRLLLRLELDPGAWVEVDVALDGGLYKTVWTAKAGDARTAVIPIRPGRCDRFQVRLQGEGRFVLRSMVREFTVGSVV